jgi:alanine dehydrogenase
MDAAPSLLLSYADVTRLLDLGECMQAVEMAFHRYAEGKTQPPKVLGTHVDGGGFHIKAGVMNLGRHYYVAKINANFPGNPGQGLPTIQGVVAVYDADDGRVLALMDSSALTIIRTGAATGVAAKYLSREDSRSLAICGCGNQGRISLLAIARVRSLEKAFVFDTDKKRAAQFAREMSDLVQIPVELVEDFRTAANQSDICITCTPSKTPVLTSGDVRQGTFIAAVGTDSEDKSEIDPSLIASSVLIADIREQSAAFGDFHHALASKRVGADHLRAELGEVIAGRKKGRISNDEVIVFDSTGMALQDVVSAAIVYEKAVNQKHASTFQFTQTQQ